MLKTKRFKVVLAITALLFAALGVILLAFKEAPIVLISYIVCGGIAFMGVLHIVQFIRKNNKSVKNQERFFDDDNSDLAFAVLFLAVAVYFFIFPKTLWELLPLFVGFCILFTSVRKIQAAFKAKDVYPQAWLAFAGIGLLGIVFGILLIINPFSGNGGIIFWAIAMLWDSITSFVMLILSVTTSDKSQQKKASRDAKKQGKDNKNIPFPNDLPVIEVDGVEVEDNSPESPQPNGQ